MKSKSIKLKLNVIAAIIMLFSFNSTILTAQNSIRINSNKGKSKISVSNSRSDFNIEYEGEIILADDDSDIKDISRGGYIEIKKSSFGKRRKIVIENDGGKLVRKYYVGWSEKDYYPEGKEWLKDILPEILRSTTIGAKSRVDRFYSKGGAKDVLSEIKKMESDYVQSAYFKLLLKKKLSNKEIVNTLETAGETINSDHYLTTILKSNQELFLKDSETIDAYISAAKSVSSDHYLTQIIKGVISNKSVSDNQLAEVLKVTKSVNSDHYMSTILNEELSVLLISILFILLAANIDIKDLMLLYNWKTAVLFSVVVFIIRPLAVFISTYKSKLKINEKLFISWVGPRGIVAAGIASLFGSKLLKQGVEGAEYITPLVFMIVLGTVLLNATTARVFAKIVGVFLTSSDGILIVGASPASRLIASYLKQNNRRVVLIDSNPNHIKKAEEMDLEAIEASVYDDDLSENIELNDIGYLMSLTGSSVINEYALAKFTQNFGEQGAFRLISSDEMKNPNDNPALGLFSHTDDFINLSEVVRDFPKVNEIDIISKEDYALKMKKLNATLTSIPIFVKSNDGKIHIISSFSEKMEVAKGNKLMYLGKELVF